MEDIILIKDVANLVLAHRVQPPSTSGTTHFEGPSNLAETIKITDVTIDVKMSDQRAKPMTIIGKEAMGTSTLVEVTTFPLT